MATNNIIIGEQNKERIEAVIRQVEGKASARCIDYNDIVKAVKTIEDRLNIPKKDLEGVRYSVDLNAQNFPNAYKYKADSTQFTVVRQGGKWRLEKVIRYTCRNEGHMFHCTDMPEATKTAILAKAVTF